MCWQPLPAINIVTKLNNIIVRFICVFLYALLRRRPSTLGLVLAAALQRVALRTTVEIGFVDTLNLEKPATSRIVQSWTKSGLCQSNQLNTSYDYRCEIGRGPNTVGKRVTVTANLNELYGALTHVSIAITRLPSCLSQLMSRLRTIILLRQLFPSVLPARARMDLRSSQSAVNRKRLYLMGKSSSSGHNVRHSPLARIGLDSTSFDGVEVEFVVGSKVSARRRNSGMGVGWQQFETFD